MSKIILVTGATGGIGRATAEGLVSRGHDVIVHGRTAAKTDATIAHLRSLHPNAKLRGVAGDLGVLADVERIAATVTSTNNRLDVLINNAGVWNSALQMTAEGHEVTFAVNHLAHVYLSHLLLPALLASAEPRIVCVGSDSHKQVRAIQFDDINLEHNYNGLRSYAQSKLANLLFCYEYERRRPGPEYPAIYNVQPGLVQTDIGLKGNIWLHRLAWRVRRRMSGNKTPAEGAATSIYLATQPDVQTRSGLYWDDRATKKSYSSSYDKDEARILWELTEEMLEIDFWNPQTQDQ